ncbi:MAG: ATP-dependent zinc metalloprotease FtsH [Clostridia bacterium]|nr:ATP-dependent zinc metalloprotease FtsH [Clostridia bacterium]
MVAKKNNNKRTLFIILAVLLLVVLFYSIYTASKTDKRLSFTEFKQMVKTEQVSEVYINDYTIYIKKANSKIKEDEFPDKFDHYCSYMNNEVVITFIEQYNESKWLNVGDYYDEATGTITRADEAQKQIGNGDTPKGELVTEAHYANGYINYDGKWDEGSWLETALPWISLGIIVILGIVIFRSMSGSGNKGFSFSRSKAKLVVSSKVRFTDVAGAEEEKQELEELVEFLRNPQQFTDLGARIPKGVLLVGPPGTGKTLLAKAVAGEAKVPFFSISGSDFVELYVGVGASRVRDLFAQAKNNSPCLVFIDEIDAVGRQRGAGMGGGNDEREQTLNQLLVEMDGFETNSGVIILAATNRADILDPALTRPGRFDRQVYVNVPDVKGREDIIKIHTRNKPISDDVDFKRVARLTSGFAGADIENMLNEAALLAARDKRVKITMVDIQEGINKVLMGPKKKSKLITEEDKKITAIHESGHAIIAHTLPNCDAVQEISIIPRGHAGGYTLTLDEKDRTHMTKQKLLDTITMMLGGRASEEVMLNDITTGASNDIERATSVARKMVAEWGMSEKFGLVSYGEGGQIFVGRDYQQTKGYSEQIATAIDQEVKSIIDEAHARAVEILKDKKELIEDLKSILLEKETIYNEEFKLLYDGASVEDVKKIMTENEIAKQKYQEEARKSAMEERKNKEITSLLETAEASLRVGLITEKDLENIKQEISRKQAEETKSENEANSKITENNADSETNDENKEN